MDEHKLKQEISMAINAIPPSKWRVNNDYTSGAYKFSKPSQSFVTQHKNYVIYLVKNQHDFCFAVVNDIYFSEIGQHPQGFAELYSKIKQYHAHMYETELPYKLIQLHKNLCTNEQ